MNKLTTMKTDNSPIVMEKLTTLETLDRSFDLEFWQRQNATARFSAAWQARVEADFDGIKVFVLSREHLIKTRNSQADRKT